MTWLLIVVLLFCALIAGLVGFTAWTARRIEAAMPPQGRFIDVPGAHLHVVDKGQGPVVLLIHGLAGQLGHFTYGIVDMLARDHRVIAVDRPGSGYSVRTAGASATLNAQADVMAALLDALKVDRAVVVGHSLGGAISLALAQRHPDRVKALALIAPLTHEPTTISAAFNGLMITQPWVRSFVAWTLALPASIAKRDEVLAMVFGPEVAPADFGTRGGGLLGVRPSHFIAASTDMAAIEKDFPGVIAGYAAMQLPVGVLYGRGDRLLDPAEQGEALAKVLPDARLALVDGGHMLPITAPEATAQFIRDVAARAA